MNRSAAHAARLTIAIASALLLTPCTTAQAGTPAAAATPPLATSGAGATCGDQLLEPGEQCDSCAADCTPAACTAKGRHVATVSLTPQGGYESVGALTVLLAYRSNRLAIPTAGGAPEVHARFAAPQKDMQLFVNDLGYGVRVVVANGDGVMPGALFDVTFDGCAGAPAPTAADLACRVESCAAGGVPLSECTCTVTLRSGGPTP